MMAQWLQLKQKLGQKLGWQGMLGAILLLTAYLFYSAVLEPMELRAAQVREQTGTPGQRAALNAQMQEAALKSPAAMLENFYAFFAGGQGVSDNLAKIYSLAQASGLELKQGEYKLQRDKDARLVQYQATLPVRGGYMQVRTFAARVLSEIPTAALEQIRFERKLAGDPNVEAEIKFTLYWVQP